MSNNFNKKVIVATGKFDKEKDYWTNKLAGYLEKCSFHYDNAAIEREDLKKEYFEFNIQGDLYTRLNKISNNSHQNMYMILMTCLKVLLYRYTGIEDISIGVPVNSGSDKSNLLNTALIIRNHIDNKATFRELLLKVRSALIEAYDNGNYPIEMLCEQLEIPIFNCVQSPIQTAIMLKNIHNIEHINCINANNIFVFEDTTSCLQCRLEYNSKLYNYTSIERIAAHFVNVLKEALSDSSKKISEIEIMSQAETSKLLYDFNQTKVQYPASMTIHQMFEEQVEKTPDNIAVVFKDSTLTYSELNQKANQIAYKLRQKGIKEESIVSILVDKSFDMFIGIMGVLKAGAAYLPLDPEYPDDRITYMLTDSNSSILLTQEHLKGRISFSGEVIPMDNDGVYTGCNSNPESKCNSKNLAYIIYTSGSTGRPKGVMIEHNSLINLCQWHKHFYKVTEADRSTKYASFGFDASVWEIFPYLTAGAAIYIVEDSIRLDIERLNKYYEDNGITISFLPTQLCEQFMKMDNKSLRMLLAGGDKLRYYQQNNYTLINNYGPTENTVVTTSLIVDKHYDNIPIGKPISNSRLYILDKDMKLQPIGAPGELYIAGDGLARGYLNREELTKEKFITNPYNIQECIYKTGDLARWLPDGNVEFLGRIDYQVKIRGFRIELGEIEGQLLEQSNIIDAVVIDREDKSGNKYLCAYIVTDCEFEISAIKEKLLERLPEYMVPAYFVKLEQIPLTPNGKVDKRALPEPETDTDSEVEYEAPANEIEEKLVNIWKEILAVETIGINDNFFNLGGHSLKAANVISNIYKSFELEIPIAIFFENPTIKGLAQAMQNTKTSEFKELKPVKEYDKLSSAQRRLYTLQQFEISSTGYNMPIVMSIEGEIDINKLEEAFRSLIQRHESLRTSFVLDNEEPTQKIQEQVHFNIDYIKANKNQVDVVINKFVKPFQLYKAPLLRVALVEIQPREYILMLDMHHIISDGLSMNILIREFTALYEGNELPKLKLQYKDYAAWQNSELTKEKRKIQEQYWLGVFKEDIPILNMNTDYPRPVVQSFEGAKISFTIDQQLTEKLKAVANRMGATMYMVLLGAYYVLLSKYSGQEDIIVGSPIAGRNHPDLQNIIGMFVNTLAMRNYPQGQKTISEFIREVKENTLRAFENQDYQFEELVDKLNITRDMSRNPLFDVMFVMQNMDIDEVAISGLTFKPYEYGSNISKFDMTLTAIESNDTISFGLEYGTKLFTQDRMERFLAHYVNILKVLTSNIDIKISDIDMIKEEERSEILTRFNETTKDYFIDRTLHQLFEEQVEKTPNNIAVMYENEKLTYRELNNKANQLARTLKIKGVEPETIVGIIANRSIEMVIGIMAILKAGGAYLPIDPKYPQDRIKYILEDSGAKVLLTQGSIDKLNSIECIYIDDENSYDADLSNLDIKIYSDSLAYVIYTSGTTGKPKGVMIEHKSISSTIQWRRDEYKLDTTDNVLQLFSFAFDGFVASFFTPIASGAKVVILNDEEAKDPIAIKRYIANSNITHFICVPSLYSAILECSNKEELKSLRIITLAGEQVSEHLLKQNKEKNENIEIINEYGPTESSVVASIKRNLQADSIVTIGKPIANRKLYIVSTHNQLQPQGVAGELCISGLGLARGYLNRPELTKEKFIENPFSTNELIYRTGDLARWLPDGNIEFLGRIDHQVKIRGFRIELGEIENQLIKHKAVRETTVIDLDDESGNKYLCAYYTIDKQIEKADDKELEQITIELREHMRKKLPEYMMPSYFVQLQEMPRNANGKIERKALPKPEGVAGISSKYEAPRNSVEEKLVSIWQEVLGITKIGINDNFFEIGGHSIRATNLAAKIHKEFKVEVSLRQVFVNPTIKGMAEQIMSADKTIFKVKDDNLVLIKYKGEDAPNLFIIHDGTGELGGYIDLCEGLTVNYNLWGIRAYNVEGYKPINISVEDMAKDYIHKIKQIQPNGIYNILGWSLGGVIALEMALQIEAINQSINLFAIDTPINRNSFTKKIFGGISTNSFTIAAEKEFIEKIIGSKALRTYNTAKLTIDELWLEVVKYLEESEDGIKLLSNAIPEELLNTMSKVNISIKDIVKYVNKVRSLSNAILNYIPSSKVQAQLHLVKAKESEMVSYSNWKKYSDHIKLYEASGDHFSIMKKPSIGEVISLLDECLRNIMI